MTCALRPGSAQDFDSEAGDDRAHFGQVAPGLFGERYRRVVDPADLDPFLDLQRDRNDGRVQLVADDARGDGVPAQADHQVEDGGAVRDLDLALAGARGEHFLGEVERVVRTLVEGQPRQVFEVLERDLRPGGQRVAARNEDVRIGEEQRVEHEPGLAQQLVDDLAR